jgi:hypothetical protein
LIDEEPSDLYATNSGSFPVVASGRWLVYQSVRVPPV